MWHGHKPAYDHLRVFGCLAHVHIGKERREGKFADTALRGIHLGYQESHHNYWVYLINDKRIVYCHDVVFNKSCFPMKGVHEPFRSDEEIDHQDQALHEPASTPLEQEPSSGELFDDNSPSSEIADIIVPMGIVEGDHIKESSPSLIETSSSIPSTEERTKKPPSKEITSAIDAANILPIRTRRSAHSAHAVAMAVHLTSPDPKTYHQALARTDTEEWKQSMQRELDNLERMGVWEEVVLPAGENALGTT